MSATRGEEVARPYVLAECTWEQVRNTSYDVAVLPWGATEAHNRHLPYATDTIESESIAIEAAARAWARGARVLVLPAVPFGVQTGQREVPFCLNMNPSTQMALLRDLVESVARHGIRKFVVLNGHGGNDFRQIIRELAPAVTPLLVQANWYASVDPRAYFAEPGDHAGEMETSVMLHLAPALVRDLSEAGAGAARPFAVSALREGWAWTPRHWVRATSDTGVGDPRAATMGKGASYVGAVVEQIGRFFEELAAVDLERLYGE